MDKDLNLVVDNGNHLILSSNKSFLELCKIVNSENTLAYYGTNYQFFDFKSKNFWNLDLEKFKLPFGFLKKKNRIPDTKIIDYLSFLRILFVKRSDTVGHVVSKKNTLFSSFWEPFTVGVLNTQCVDASAFLLKKVLLETFLKGPNFSGIIQPRDSWDKTLISPARDFLMKKNVNLNFNDALRKIVIKDNLINELIFKEKKKKIYSGDLVVLAIPPSNVKRFLPFLSLPDEYNPIVNIHFKFDTKKLNLKHKVIGMLNSISQWVFIKNGYFSITISAANDLLFEQKEKMVTAIWKEISILFSLKKQCLPEFKIIIEKKATYNQTPKNHKLTKNINYIPKNLRIIGDWTQFNFPSTIESSILSAKKLCQQLI